MERIIGAILMICGVIGGLVTFAVFAFNINIYLGFIVLFGEMFFLGGLLLNMEYGCEEEIDMED
jgi:hypothetical protein